MCEWSLYGLWKFWVWTRRIEKQCSITGGFPEKVKIDKNRKGTPCRFYFFGPFFWNLLVGFDWKRCFSHPMVSASEILKNFHQIQLFLTKVILLKNLRSVRGIYWKNPFFFPQKIYINGKTEFFWEKWLCFWLKKYI